MLQVKDLRCGYDESMVLSGLDFQIKPGETAALMGLNGVGKTTFLRALAGLQPIKAGSISFDDNNITNWAPEKRAWQGIGYVPQGREIFPFLSVRENLTLGLIARGEKARIPEDVLELFPMLKDHLDRKGGDLSGGQQQQLAIARILATKPSLILLDEPTEGVQPSIVQDIGNIIRFIKEQGKISVLLVEQFVDFALGLADTVHVMRKGAIGFTCAVGDLTPEQKERELAL